MTVLPGRMHCFQFTSVKVTRQTREVPDHSTDNTSWITWKSRLRMKKNVVIMYHTRRKLAAKCGGQKSSLGEKNLHHSSLMI